MIRSVFKAAFAVAALAAGTGTARADFVNGGFETGNLTGFDVSTGGVAQVLNAAGLGIAPPSGTFAARLTTVGTTIVTGPTGLATFLGVAPAALNPGLGNVTAGTAIRQTVMVNAGDVLTFNWNFLTNEATPGGAFNDTAFVTISAGVPGLATTTELADTGFATFLPAPVPTGFAEQTGFQTFSFTFTTGGLFTIGFGVVDLGDTIIDSALILDNLQVAAVPEPTSLALAGLGVAGLAAYRRRKLAKVA